MRSIFITLILLGLFGSCAQATDLRVPQRKIKTEISKCPHGKCDDFLNHRSHGPVPYDGDRICSTFVQGHTVQMMIQFFDEHGVELDAGDRVHTKRARAVDRICPGRHWFEKARLGYVKLCNEDNHISVLYTAQIDACLANGSCTPLDTNYICLLGDEVCAQKRKLAAQMLSQ